MKCPRYNCEYDTATRPAANRSEQQELELLRAHAVVVHVVGTKNLVFACLKCGVKCYPLSAGVGTVLQECSIHDQSCSGAFMMLGPGRRVRLEEWVMHLRVMASDRNNFLGVVEPVDSHEVNTYVMTCMYKGCDYTAPTGATMDEAMECIKIHDCARHQQPVIQQQQQALVEQENNKLVGRPVNSMVMDREEQQLQAASNTLGEDSEGGSFAKDISSVGWIVESHHRLEVADKKQYPGVMKKITNGETEKLVGKPVLAANTRQEETCDAEHSEESHVVYCQQGELVGNAVDTVRMERQLQAGSTTLVENQGAGEMISVGSGKITLQCGDCNHQTHQVNPKKPRQRLAQHRKWSHTEVVVIPDQVEGGPACPGRGFRESLPSGGAGVRES
jgi:hypothetical protein